MSIVWLESREIIHFHAELMSEHGGLPGPPKEAALEATVARPQNLLAYNSESTVFKLAASYGFGFARNHCFPDGNRRVALISIAVFLAVNGYELEVAEVNAVVTIQGVAKGSITETQLTEWLAANSKPRRK